MVARLDDDLLALKVINDPYTHFSRMREEAPVHWNEKWRGWVVTRFDDSQAAMRDQRLAADTVTPYYKQRLTDRERTKWKPLFDTLSSWIVFMDPPDHTRLRRLMSKAFSPRVVEAMRPAVKSMAEQLLDDLDGADEFDLVADFSFPLPANVIALMLGARQEDLWIMQEWSREVVNVSLGGVDVPDRHQRAQTSLLEFKEYLRPVLEDRRRNPRESDLVTELLAAEEDGQHLTVDELLASAILLLIAGHETTQNLIANAMVCLLQHPDEMARLRTDRGLMRSAVEEVLRFDGPVKATIRQVKEPLEIRGQKMAVDDRVLVVFAGANRDPERFPDPNRLDVARNESQHLGFGQGIHYCLGAPLARLETQVALDVLLDRYDDFELGTEVVDYERKLITRAPVAVPIKVR